MKKDEYHYAVKVSDTTKDENRLKADNQKPAIVLLLKIIIFSPSPFVT